MWNGLQNTQMWLKKEGHKCSEGCSCINCPNVNGAQSDIEEEGELETEDKMNRFIL